MTETATIEFEIIRNEQGRHVCRTVDKICPFLGNARFGTNQVCMLGENKKLHLWDDDPAGYIMPICGLAKLESNGEVK